MKAGDKVRVVEHAGHRHGPYDEVGEIRTVIRYAGPEFVIAVKDDGRFLAYSERQLAVVEE